MLCAMQPKACAEDAACSGAPPRITEAAACASQVWNVRMRSCSCPLVTQLFAIFLGTISRTLTKLADTPLRISQLGFPFASGARRFAYDNYSVKSIGVSQPVTSSLKHPNSELIAKSRHRSCAHEFLAYCLMHRPCAAARGVRGRSCGLSGPSRNSGLARLNSCQEIH